VHPHHPSSSAPPARSSAFVSPETNEDLARSACGCTPPLPLADRRHGASKHCGGTLFQLHCPPRSLSLFLSSSDAWHAPRTPTSRQHDSATATPFWHVTAPSFFVG
jgi:hypothetical protein